MHAAVCIGSRPASRPACGALNDPACLACLPACLPSCLQVPLDGEVVHGRAMVSSEHITGESLPVLCRVGDEVRAACGRLAGQPLCGLGTPLGKLAGRQWWLINSI